MGSPLLEGRIEQVRKSLFLVLKDIHTKTEQYIPIVEVKPSSSYCVQYDLWEQALENFDPEEEIPITNPNKLASQIESILEQIKAHRQIKCDCEETSETKYFRGLDYHVSQNKLWLVVRLFSNRTQGIVEFEVEQFQNHVDFLRRLHDIALWGTSHENYNGADILDLSNIEHDGLEVLLSVGELYETWLFKLDRPLFDEEKVVVKELEEALEKGIAFQKSKLS